MLLLLLLTHMYMAATSLVQVPTLHNGRSCKFVILTKAKAAVLNVRVSPLIFVIAITVALRYS
jgi:hypothetical protein